MSFSLLMLANAGLNQWCERRMFTRQVIAWQQIDKLKVYRTWSLDRCAPLR